MKNIGGLHLNFVECEPFLKSNSHDILILYETSLDDSIDSDNFSMTDYLPIVQNNSITHICIALQLKRRKDFLLHRLISGKLYRSLLMFLAAFTKLIVLRLCPLSTTLFNFMYGLYSISSRLLGIKKQTCGALHA